MYKKFSLSIILGKVTLIQGATFIVFAKCSRGYVYYALFTVVGFFKSNKNLEIVLILDGIKCELLQFSVFEIFQVRAQMYVLLPFGSVMWSVLNGTISIT